MTQAGCGWGTVSFGIPVLGHSQYSRFLAAGLAMRRGCWLWDPSSFEGGGGGQCS